MTGARAVWSTDAPVSPEAAREYAVDRTPVIVGTGLSDYPKAPHLDGVEHHVQAFQRALADSGLEKSEIDGYVCAGGGGLMIDDAADDGRVPADRPPLARRDVDRRLVVRVLRPARSRRRSARGCATSCSSPTAPTMLSRMGRKLGTGGFQRPGSRVGGPIQYEAPYGNSLVGAYAMAARRHMHEFGTTPGTAGRDRGRRPRVRRPEPARQYRDPITVDDVLNSPHDRRPAAQARLLRDLRRRRRRAS